MMPIHELARLMHEERVSEAERRRPEWVYEAALAKRAQREAGASHQLRSAFAQALRRLAASVEPAAIPSSAPSE